MFKLFERLIQIRWTQSQYNILYQRKEVHSLGAGALAKSSCSSRTLMIGLERVELTGLVLLHLTAAYDTENSWLLFNNLYHTTKDYHPTELMEKLLIENIRFFGVLKL